MALLAEFLPGGEKIRVASPPEYLAAASSEDEGVWMLLAGGGYINPLPLIVVDGGGRTAILLPANILIMRETTISVSNGEKTALDEAKLELYNTDEVPYGTVIYELAGRVTDTDE